MADKRESCHGREANERENWASQAYMISSEVFSLSFRVSVRAYTSQAMEENPQPLCIAPRLWRKAVTVVFTRRGIQRLPNNFTANQKTTRSKASLRQSVEARRFPTEKTVAFCLAYLKWPVADSVNARTFKVKQTINSRLYTVNSPWSSIITDNLESFCFDSCFFELTAVTTIDDVSWFSMSSAIYNYCSSISKSSNSRSQKWLLAWTTRTPNRIRGSSPWKPNQFSILLLLCREGTGMENGFSL